jgi:hypothetical protein
LVEIVNRVLFTASGGLKINEKSFDTVGGCDKFSSMKTASLKITTVNVNGLNKDRVYTGDDLCQRNATYVPVGFFQNTNKGFTGIVFRDHGGNCTYFDRTHGLIYPMDSGVWNEATFTFIPEMQSFTVGFDKKAKKTVDTVSA